MNDSLFSSAVESERLRAQQLATDGRSTQYPRGNGGRARIRTRRKVTWSP